MTTMEMQLLGTSQRAAMADAAAGDSAVAAIDPVKDLTLAELRASKKQVHAEAFGTAGRRGRRNPRLPATSDRRGFLESAAAACRLVGAWNLPLPR